MHEVCPRLRNGRMPLLINALYKYKAILRQKKPAECQFFQRGMVIACRTILKLQVPRDHQLTFRMWLPRRLILTFKRPSFPREQIEPSDQKNNVKTVFFEKCLEKMCARFFGCKFVRHLWLQRVNLCWTSPAPLQLAPTRVRIELE